MVSKARTPLLIFFIFFSFQSFGQISFDSQEELEKAANGYFEAEDYTKAKPLFSQLLSKNALDPNYNYRFGVCIMFTEADPLKPLPYIEGGANSGGVNAEAHYFLGKVYQLNYRFDDAIKAYEKGKSSGFSSPKVDLDRSMEECRNGKILYNADIDFKPAMDKEVIAAEFYRPYDFRKLKGKVIPMPPNFKTKYDEKSLVGTVIYTPMNSEVLVYASYGENGANGKDLYRVNRLPNGEWAIPQRLPDVINTRFDEDYAFYDDESQTLFFASKGHNTMGGYDVFSSKYDADANSWSAPMNLQFPINSPFDDFLYVSDPEGKLAFFTSGRNTEAGKLRVLKTLLHDPNQVEVSVVEGTFEDQTDSVYNYAALTVIDPQTNDVVGKYRTNKLTGKYLLILPPQNDYTMDVGPKEANGFKFDLDVPKHEPTDPLEQRVVFNSKDDRATVSVTNYFDGAGNADTVKFAENRSLSEVTEQMTKMPELTADELAQQKPKANDNAAKEQQLAAAKEKARLDSIKQVEALALKKQQEEAEAQAKLIAEKARQDSIQEVQQLAAAKEKAKQDSIVSAQALVLKQQQEEQAAKEELARKEQARLDSIKAVEEAALAAELKSQEAAILAEELARKEQAQLDSAKVAEEAALAAELKAQEDAMLAEERAAEKALMAEKAREDSLKDILAQEMREKEEAIKAELLAKRREKEVADSLANVALAQTKAREKATADSIIKAEQLKLEEKLAAAKAEQEKRHQQAAADSAAAVELALKAEQEKAMADSVAKVEADLALTKAQREKAVADSIAEVERLAAIEKEVEEAKQRALQDSMVVNDVAQEKPEVEEKQATTYSDILKEMAAKEAEILARKKDTAQKEEITAAADTTESVKEVAEAPQVSLEETEIVSESDLFLQTIANLEKQKEGQKRLVEEENRLRQEQKSKPKVETPKEETGEELTALVVRPDSAVIYVEGDVTKVIPDSTAEVAELPTEEAMEPVALKSDADPNAYLAALNEIEAQVAEDAKAHPEKDYSLRSMKELQPSGKEEVDPVLQQKIEADRKAVAEHQSVAKAKEEELKAQMERDRKVLDVYEGELASELAEAEGEMVAADTAASKPRKLSDILAAKQARIEAAEQVREEINPAEQELVLEADKAMEEEAPAGAPKVEEVTVVPVEEVPAEPVAVDEELLNELAEVDEIAASEIVEEKPAPVVETPKEESAQVEEVAPVVAEEVAVEEPMAAEEELLEELAEIDAVKVEEKAEEVKEQPVAVAPVVEEKVEEKKPEVTEVSQTEEPVEVAVEEPKKVEEAAALKEAAVGTVGTIHTLTAAKRDYSRAKPSYESVENEDMRRTIKRMRAEDVGRLAVLKNMKNEWVQAGKTQNALAQIKDNRRNQDVLANLPTTKGREEYIRPPFDKNDLRARQDVYYKLVFVIEPAGVSETVSAAMSPESAITFAMPSVNFSSGYYVSLADVRADMKDYQNRGLNNVRIVPFLNGSEVTLSDVQHVPFVD